MQQALHAQSLSSVCYSSTVRRSPDSRVTQEPLTGAESMLETSAEWFSALPRDPSPLALLVVSLLGLAASVGVAMIPLTRRFRRLDAAIRDLVVFQAEQRLEELRLETLAAGSEGRVD